MSMKPIKYLFSLLFAMVGLSSCDTYGDYEQEFSPVYPLSGQYYVKVIDETGKEIVMHTITGPDGQKTDVFGTYMYLYNTTDNDKDKLWIKLPSDESFSAGILGKINCNVSGTAGNMEADGTTVNGEFTVNSGILTLKSVITPTNGKSDGIEVKYTLSGKTYTVTGFRRTGWDADETWSTPQVNN